MRMQNLNTNHIISYFISRLQVGLLRRLRFIKLVKTDIVLRLLRILYKHGIIRTYCIHNDYVSVYLKYIMVSLLFLLKAFRAQASVVIDL